MTPDPSESTIELLQRVKQGDHGALEVLLERHLPRLRRWASGRLPRYVRDGSDTEDLVQETVIRTLRTIEAFEYRREGALQAYLRQALYNRIRDRIRQAGRRPRLESDRRGSARSRESLRWSRRSDIRPRSAMRPPLRPSNRATARRFVGRLELGYDYSELASALAKPTSEAARKAVGRAVLRLAEKMTEIEKPS
jgi:RNA polymerase sigma-70 factor (ECF subfamily)